MQLTSTLASRVDGRLDRDADARASGLIINTCGWIDASGYDVLLHCIEVFAIDVILVMGHDKLFSKFTSDASDHITVVKLPKSGGVVERVSIRHWRLLLNAIRCHRFVSNCRSSLSSLLGRNYSQQVQEIQDPRVLLRPSSAYLHTTVIRAIQISGTEQFVLSCTARSPS